MSAYLLSLVAISAIVGVCSYASYGDRDDKYLKAASSLILVYVIISPLVAIIRDVAEYNFNGDFSLDSFESINDTELADKAESAFCEGVEKYICDKFSLSEGEVKAVTFEFNCKNMTARKIKIILSGRAALADSRAIAEEIRSKGEWECEVELSVK